MKEYYKGMVEATINGDLSAKKELLNVLNYIDELEQENQKLKVQLEEYQRQNLNLREDVIIKKMSFSKKETKDKSLLELYNMPSYEDLKKENQQLKTEKAQLNSLVNSCQEEIRRLKRELNALKVSDEKWLEKSDK